MLVLFVLQEATALGAMPSRLTLRQIADAMFRPPNIRNGGPTEIDILPVLPDTDTKSYEDYHRTAAHLDDHCAASVKVKLDWTDGQGCITGALPTLILHNWTDAFGVVHSCKHMCTGKNGKVKFPELYANRVVCVSGFHEHAHSAFAINEMYFEKYLAWCYNQVG